MTARCAVRHEQGLQTVMDLNIEKAHFIFCMQTKRTALHLSSRNNHKDVMECILTAVSMLPEASTAGLKDWKQCFRILLLLLVFVHLLTQFFGKRHFFLGCGHSRKSIGARAVTLTQLLICLSVSIDLYQNSCFFYVFRAKQMVLLMSVCMGIHSHICRLDVLVWYGAGTSGMHGHQNWPFIATPLNAISHYSCHFCFLI